jgi:5-formyltetrahydrofolate cyclo-ligase
MTTAGQPYPARVAGLDPTETKDEMRRAIRAVRDKMPQRARTMAAAGFARVVADLPAVRSAQVVAAYVSRPNEPDTLPLMERLAERGVRILLPVLGTGLQRDWAWFTSAEELQVRAPGRPPEPSGPTLGAEALSLAEAVIVPALAVDTAGGRLGQGGGWYDRVLAHARPGTPVIALVFPDEVYDAAVRPLPRQAHDQPVDVIATPTGWQGVGGPDVSPAEGPPAGA